MYQAQASGLSGQYGLRRETLDFRGNLFMDAKVSQTVGGYKSILLRAADPLFNRDGRTVIPIQITGTRQDPSFGLDRSRLFHRDGSTSDQRPGARG